MKSLCGNVPAYCFLFLLYNVFSCWFIAGRSQHFCIIAIGVISASCETHSSPARRTIGLAKGRIFSPSRTSTGTHPSPARRTIGLGGDKKFMHHARQCENLKLLKQPSVKLPSSVETRSKKTLITDVHIVM